MLADVITPAGNWSLERPLLTYEVPTELEAEVQPGQLVALPYGERLVEGLIWLLHPSAIPVGSVPGTAPPGAVPLSAPSSPTDTLIRPVHAVLDPVPVLLPFQMQLAQWIA